jgi:hypothetical protein
MSSDLKYLSSSLIDTLKNSFHVRIEYPWQREERAAAQAEAQSRRAPSATQRLLVDARLDSTDVPRLPEAPPRADEPTPGR